MTNTIAGERFRQTLGDILVTPAGRAALFLGRSLPVLATGLFVAALSLTVASLLLDVAVYGVLGFAYLRVMEQRSRRHASLEVA